MQSTNMCLYRFKNAEMSQAKLFPIFGRDKPESTEGAYAKRPL